MAEPSERAWVVDDEPNDRFPIWTRGSVGEVLPDGAWVEVDGTNGTVRVIHLP